MVTDMMAPGLPAAALLILFLEDDHCIIFPHQTSHTAIKTIVIIAPCSPAPVERKDDQGQMCGTSAT